METAVTAPAQEKAADMARQLIANGTEVLAAIGTANAIAGKQASSTLPVVMLASGYPVQAGLAESLARPGGNVTGLTVYAGTEIFGKSVSLAKELAPALRDLGVLWGYASPEFPEIEIEICRKEIADAADALKIRRVHFWINRTPRDLDTSLSAAAAAPVQALLMTSGGPQSTSHGIAKVAEFCEKHRVPAVADVASGIFRSAGIATYSPDFAELGIRGASFVDRILRGAKPAELPIEHPSRFQLHVNVKRAKLIGLALPQSVLVRADRVVE